MKINKSRLSLIVQISILTVVSLLLALIFWIGYYAVTQAIPVLGVQLSIWSGLFKQIAADIHKLSAISLEISTIASDINAMAKDVDKIIKIIEKV